MVNLLPIPLQGPRIRKHPAFDPAFLPFGKRVIVLDATPIYAVGGDPQAVQRRCMRQGFLEEMLHKRKNRWELCDVKTLFRLLLTVFVVITLQIMIIHVMVWKHRK